MLNTSPLIRPFPFLAVALCLALTTGRALPESSAPLGSEHSIETRVADLLGRMTLEEKASQLVSHPPAIPRLGIPAFIWDNEGKHALVSSFPASIGLAATWDPEITRAVADAISDEGRALNNQRILDGETQRYLCYWAPTVNMARDPRWGRINESFGEDPYLTSRLAVSFIQGMQGNDPIYLKAAAGINHFAVYSEERDRHSVDATLPNEQLLRDYYLPHFEAGVQAGAAAVGATNNGLNGVPLCVNRFLLTNILRQEWGFKGFVFSDAASVEDIWKLRGYAPDGATASSLTLDAGCEINTGLGNTHARFLPETIRRGLLDEESLNEACRRVLTVQFRLGLYDPAEKNPYRKIPSSVIDSPEHRELARNAARESLVLLKNENSMLPLDLNKLKRIIVAGPRADQPELGRKQTGSSTLNVSALDAIRRQAAAAHVEVIYEKEPHASVQAAASADVILFFTSLMEGEVCDRMNLGLSPRQEQHLLDLTATRVPVIVVLVGGGSVMMEHWADRVPALLAAWYPGMEGGNAIADVLFGAANPSGKLPLTFYRTPGQLLPFDEFDIRKGHTYMYCRSPVQFPFGHGLSYTTFRYSQLRISSDANQPGHVTVQADLTNTGMRPGKEIAQLYLRAKQRSTGDQPLRQLRGFEKIMLQPGESRTVRWTLTPADLAFHDATMSHIVEPGEIEVLVGGSSADDALSGSFVIPSKITVRKAASFRFDDLPSTPDEVSPNEPLNLFIGVENTGETTGSPQVMVDGKPHAWGGHPVGPGEKSTILISLRLHESGTRRIKIGELPEFSVRVKSGPARLVCEDMESPLTASTGEAFAVRVKVRNTGGSSGMRTLPMFVNDTRVTDVQVRLAPGESVELPLKHSFDHPGSHRLSVDGLPARTVQVGGPIDVGYRTFANTLVADFHQSAPGCFFIRATGALGSSWLEENNGAQATRDSYAALYQPRAAGSQCVVTLRIDSQDLISNHTKSGIMIRNSIARPGESNGYLVHGINSYYGGVGNIEWDADGDGYLEKHTVFDPGGFPKWLKLEKNGKTFRFFSSSDSGSSWTLQRTLELPSAADVQDVGLFVVSDTEERPALVQFSEFKIEEGLFAGSFADAQTSPQSKPEQPY